MERTGDTARLNVCYFAVVLAILIKGSLSIAVTTEGEKAVHLTSRSEDGLYY